MKKGDIVICVKYQNYWFPLTKGNQYIILDIDKKIGVHHILISDDAGNKLFYEKDNFKLLSKYRNKLIDKILYEER